MRISSDGELFRCSACGVEKPSASFSFSNKARQLLSAYCRVCHARYRRNHYLAHKPDYIRRAIAQVARRRSENRSNVLAYLSNHACIDCGNSDPVVLEFDHRDPTQKLAAVGTMLMSRRWARVRAEIEKCDVRCVNCHRRKTARENGWIELLPSSRMRN